MSRLVESAFSDVSPKAAAFSEAGWMRAIGHKETVGYISGDIRLSAGSRPSTFEFTGLCGFIAPVRVE